jgi:hypothetical protein
LQQTDPDEGSAKALIPGPAKTTASRSAGSSPAASRNRVEAAWSVRTGDSLSIASQAPASTDSSDTGAEPVAADGERQPHGAGEAQQAVSQRGRFSWAQGPASA